MQALSTIPAGEDIIDLDSPIPYTISPLARAALANNVAFEDVDAYVAAAHSRNRPLVIDSPLDHELDVALFESFHAREPRRSVLFWREAGL